MTFAAEAGHTVAGKYELVRLLGRGSMGDVWLARHKTLAEEVALKFLTVEAIEDEDPSVWLTRFLFEAQIAARLSRRSRHIVSVTDHGEESGTAYLVMERLEGEPLADALGRLAPVDAREIISQVARGLAQAHGEGVIHRDLKPANIFLARDEDGNILVKILDFGIARGPRPKGLEASARAATERGLILGTTSHMSPEQGQGLASLDYRCDLWALGVVAYEMLTGALPFVGDTREELFASILMRRFVAVGSRRPGLMAFEPFFERAFAANIEERFQTADQLTEAFGAVPTLGGEGVEPSDPAASAIARARSSSGSTVLETRVATTERAWSFGRWAAVLLAVSAACVAIIIRAGSISFFVGGTKAIAPQTAIVVATAAPPASPIPAAMVAMAPVVSATSRSLPVAKKPPRIPGTSTTKKHLDKGEVF